MFVTMVCFRCWNRRQHWTRRQSIQSSCLSPRTSTWPLSRIVPILVGHSNLLSIDMNIFVLFCYGHPLFSLRQIADLNRLGKFFNSSSLSCIEKRTELCFYISLRGKSILARAVIFVYNRLSLVILNTTINFRNELFWI